MVKSQREERQDTADTYGVRGAGAVTWQARWGMKLNETDLLFAVRREPIYKRTVVDVAYDMFAKGFTIEEVGENPDLIGAVQDYPSSSKSKNSPNE
jgi:hypothetical protein